MLKRRRKAGRSRNGKSPVQMREPIARPDQTVAFTTTMTNSPAFPWGATDSRTAAWHRPHLTSRRQLTPSPKPLSASETSTVSAKIHSQWTEQLETPCSRTQSRFPSTETTSTLSNLTSPNKLDLWRIERKSRRFMASSSRRASNWTPCSTSWAKLFKCEI